ncbi:MAG: hypothetical protein Q4C04_01650 [Clostridia bacterium]|nr:hypothetical protein [Clostridia bacterium]
MTGEPLKSEKLRPSKALLERFAAHDVAKLSDSMGKYGALRSNIKPLSDAMRVCGPALTVKSMPGDPSWVDLIAEVAQAGDVVVVAADEIEDLMIADKAVCDRLKALGIAGLVADGALADKQTFIEKGLPAFVICTTQRRLYKQDGATVNEPICCSGMIVCPGDLIVGDSDGVVVVPGYDLERVIELADRQLQKELRNRSVLMTGVSPREYYGFEAKMDKWREALQNQERKGL